MLHNRSTTNRVKPQNKNPKTHEHPSLPAGVHERLETRVTVVQQLLKNISGNYFTYTIFSGLNIVLNLSFEKLCRFHLILERLTIKTNGKNSRRFDRSSHQAKC